MPIMGRRRMGGTHRTGGTAGGVRRRKASPINCSQTVQYHHPRHPPVVSLRSRGLEGHYLQTGCSSWSGSRETFLSFARHAQWQVAPPPSPPPRLPPTPPIRMCSYWENVRAVPEQQQEELITAQLSISKSQPNNQSVAQSHNTCKRGALHRSAIGVEPHWPGLRSSGSSGRAFPQGRHCTGTLAAGADRRRW